LLNHSNSVFVNSGDGSRSPDKRPEMVMGGQFAQLRILFRGDHGPEQRQIPAESFARKGFIAQGLDEKDRHRQAGQRYR